MQRSWIEFIEKARPSVDWTEAGLVLCLDPGQTTGWALFGQAQLIDQGQVETDLNPAIMAEHIRDIQQRLLDYGDLGLDLIVFEEYRVRGNKAKQHVGSEVITIQHIGAIKVAADMLDIPLRKQTAGQVKAFATDVKLRRWGLYQTGQRHANDAIRHGVYYHLFGFRPEDPRRVRSSTPDPDNE